MVRNGIALQKTRLLLSMLIAFTQQLPVALTLLVHNGTKNLRAALLGVRPSHLPPLGPQRDQYLLRNAAGAKGSGVFAHRWPALYSSA